MATAASGTFISCCFARHSGHRSASHVDLTCAAMSSADGAGGAGAASASA